MHEHSLSWFMEEFEKLQCKALEYGINSVLLLDEEDRLQKQSQFVMNWHAYKSTAMGMVLRAQRKLMEEES